MTGMGYQYVTKVHDYFVTIMYDYSLCLLWKWWSWVFDIVGFDFEIREGVFLLLCLASWLLKQYYVQDHGYYRSIQGEDKQNYVKVSSRSILDQQYQQKFFLKIIALSYKMVEGDIVDI